jgi:hypothetical protein
MDASFTVLAAPVAVAAAAAVFVDEMSFDEGVFKKLLNCMKPSSASDNKGEFGAEEKLKCGVVVLESSSTSNPTS